MHGFGYDHPIDLCVPMSNWMILGTDTGAGKTIVTAALAAYWLKHSQGSVAIYKPVQCGIGDQEYYRTIFAETLRVVVDQQFEAGIAPPLAAAQVGKTVDLASLWQTYQQLSAAQDSVLVEGVGGLGCPLTWDYTIADLACDWRIPALLVAPIRLGAVGQLVASVGYARKLGLGLSGIILCEVTREPDKDLADRHLIENLCQLPILGVIPYLEDMSDLDALANAAAGLWLEAIGWGVKR
jgi:dethiobiotin synthetase